LLTTPALPPFLPSSFSLSSVSYSGSGSDSFGSQDSSSGAWSGSYSGNDSTSDQGGGQDSWSSGATGNFQSGSYSLTSYSLQGCSSGSYSFSTGETQSFLGQVRSSHRGESGQESNSLYQAGTQPAGMMYSNSSYLYQDTGSSSATDQSQGPGASSSDTWTQQNSTQLTLNALQTISVAGPLINARRRWVTCSAGHDSLYR
jgi:hypothetical protein